ncbi:Condensin complex subunit [Puccinia graminis f. sp. tritici]|uniref:Condensin complex subunit 1 n=1 Tax=Puccinia graminis f. sp. tritici TaxID=56615 RepID=A0A5B0SLI1_PUCGR|nr:Condensin complex subunit [Puccinia graminis f. sp. tritici]
MPSPWNLPSALIGLLDTPEIENETDFESMDQSEIKRTVNHLVDRLTSSSESIGDSEIFQKFQSLLKHALSIPQTALHSILDVLLFGFEAEVTSTLRDANPSDHTAYKSHRANLERFGFLLIWLVEICEKRRLTERGIEGHSNPNLTDKSKSTKAKNSKSKSRQPSSDKNAPFDWTNQIPDILNAMLKALSLKTEFIWPTSQERDAFVGCFTKPVYQILEMKAFADSVAIRVPAFKIICTAAKSHGQTYSTQTSILQKLQYFDHLSEYMAELTHLLVETKDLPQVADSILREISSKTFSAQDTKGPRSFSRYLVKLTTLSPRLVFRQIVMLQKHLDSESYVMRICLLEVFGKLIEALSQDDDQQTQNPPQSNRNPNDLDENEQVANPSGNGRDKEKQSQVVKLDGFFNLLFERFCDSNTFVRVKVVNIFEDILKLTVPFPKHRLRLAARALRSLEDKSSQVRKHCMTVLSRLIETHPYGVMHGGELGIDEWQARYDAIVKELSVFDLPGNGVDEEVRKIMEGEEKEEEDGSGAQDDEPTSEANDSNAENRRSGEDDESMSDGNSGSDKTTKRNKTPRPSQADMDAAAGDQQAALSNYDHESLMKLRLTKKYYSDAIQFIQILQSAVPSIEKLLASKVKSEVLEAIYFFKTAWNYKVQGAQDGIKRMLHLIWSTENSTVEETTKDAAAGNEDGPKEVKEIKGVRFALIDCYQELYFAPLVRQPGETVSAYANRNIARITRNMIELTYQATLAELTSLEELMGVMMERGYVHEDVIYKLWEVYSTSKDIPKQQRRGAIIVLGMLAAPRPNVVADNLDKLVAIGLGPIGKGDLVLARYSCIALSRIGGSAKKVKGSLIDRNIRLPLDNPVFRKLADIIQTPTRSKEWFAMAEQALNTIYGLGDQPDLLCTEILQTMALKCFEGVPEEPNQSDAMEVDPQIIPESQVESQEQPTETQRPTSPVRNSALSSSQGPRLLADSFALSQVIFLAGHVAVKHLVHLELVEREFKRRKAESDELKKKQNPRKTGHNDKDKDIEGEELDQVAGNVEDDIGDVIAHAREKELLFGHQSLLGVFAPMTVQICGLPAVYKNETLQTAAALSLGKFMCVSAEFCEKHLMLLFKILEKSKSPAVRSNIIIALGDIAVCFATIMDQHSDGLYKGLTDSDLEVKKNTLMVLTHLILNGMIKVKGQLGEIAKCINDPEKRISDLAQLFFDELSKKDQNAIYNNLPDMISHLSVGKHAVDAPLFQSVMDNIFKHLKKDKQSESIVEKLCQRFRLVSEVRQWQDIAYCLSLLQFKSEKALKKLVDGLPSYQDKLYDPEVFKSFEDILTKVKANKWAKEHADLVEFEKALRAQKEKGEEDKQMENKVQKKQSVVRKRRQKQNSNQSPPPRNRHENEDEDEVDWQNEDRGSNKNSNSKSKPSVTRPTRSTRKGTRKRDATPSSDE